MFKVFFLAQIIKKIYFSVRIVKSPSYATVHCVQSSLEDTVTFQEDPLQLSLFS